jgi:prepilin-type processing-associated H-X9-DG protein
VLLVAVAGGVTYAPLATWLLLRRGWTWILALATFTWCLLVLVLLPTVAMQTPLPMVALLVLVVPVYNIHRAARQGKSFGQSAAVAAAVLFLYLVFFLPAFRPWRLPANQDNCLSHVKQIALALSAYAEDNGGHLPHAEDWVNGVWPYIPNERPFRCPQVFDVGVVVTPYRSTDYAFSRYADWLDIKRGSDMDSVGVVFDGTALVGGEEVAAYRHNSGVNLGFADGHARWEAKDNLGQYVEAVAGSKP